jgi:hypothetical protein
MLDCSTFIYHLPSTAALHHHLLLNIAGHLLNHHSLVHGVLSVNMNNDKTHLAGEDIDYPKQVKQEVNVLTRVNTPTYALLIHITIMSTLLHWILNPAFSASILNRCIFLEGW